MNSCRWIPLVLSDNVVWRLTHHAELGRPSRRRAIAARRRYVLTDPAILCSFLYPCVLIAPSSLDLHIRLTSPIIDIIRINDINDRNLRKWHN